MLLMKRSRSPSGRHNRSAVPTIAVLFSLCLSPGAGQGWLTPEDNRQPDTESSLIRAGLTTLLTHALTTPTNERTESSFARRNRVKHPPTNIAATPAERFSTLRAAMHRLSLAGSESLVYSFSCGSLPQGRAPPLSA
jgi:hypothetical protein